MELLDVPLPEKQNIYDAHRKKMRLTFQENDNFLPD